MISKYLFLYFSFDKKIKKVANLDKERITPLATKICKKKRLGDKSQNVVRDAKWKNIVGIFFKIHCQ